MEDVAGWMRHFAHGGGALRGALGGVAVDRTHRNTWSGRKEDVGRQETASDPPKTEKRRRNAARRGEEEVQARLDLDARPIAPTTSEEASAARSNPRISRGSGRSRNQEPRHRNTC